MAWPCYYALDGTEIINAARTEAYAESVPWFKPVYKPEHLDVILDETYVDPVTDDAPWYDEDVAESKGFFGAYPLGITGIEDSTRQSTVIESTLDGGTPGRLRHATRAAVFNVVLIAESEQSADYGMRWLKQALLGSPCGSSVPGTTGSQLCYFSSDPGASGLFCVPSDGVDHEDAYGRSLYRVLVNQGPTVSAKSTMPDGGAVWTVQWTLIAGVPWEYGDEVQIVTGFPGDSMVLFHGATADTTGHEIDEADFGLCPQPYYIPVVDPLCPALTPPPVPPDVPLVCYTPPDSWVRRQFTIPASVLPEWSDAVVKITITPTTAPVRNLRVRIYADPLGTTDPDDDPCAFCADLVDTYTPQGGSLVLDGIVETIAYEDVSSSRRADQLVMDSTGKPVSWPLLPCGIEYIVVVDTPVGQVVPDLDFSVFVRNA